MMDLYWKILTIARLVGYAEGYAITLHGSGIRDLDLVACPWTDKACDPDMLVKRLIDELNLGKITARSVDAVPQEGECWPAPCLKPHGRLAVTIFVERLFHVDLSIMPRIEGG